LSGLDTSNRIRLDWRPSKREINTHYCSQNECVYKVGLHATLVYSTVDSGLTITQSPRVL